MTPPRTATKHNPANPAAPVQNRRDLMPLPFFDNDGVLAGLEHVRTHGRFTLRQRGRAVYDALGHGLCTIVSVGVIFSSGSSKEDLLLFTILGLSSGVRGGTLAWRAITTPRTSAYEVITRVGWDALARELVCFCGDTEVFLCRARRVRITSSPLKHGRGRALLLHVDLQPVATAEVTSEQAEIAVANFQRDGVTVLVR